MTYADYVRNGWNYTDYARLSQCERLRGLVAEWRASRAVDKGIQIAALWDADDPDNDWERVRDWWHPRQWHRWVWGIDQCQNFHRINLGPMVILVAT